MMTILSRCFLILFALSIVVSCSKKEVQRTWNLRSPDGKVNVTLYHDTDDGRLTYDVALMNESGAVQVLEQSPLGILRADQAFDSLLTMVSVDSVVRIEETYTLTSGKQLVNHNHAKELSLTLKNKNDAQIRVTFRAYDDGAAFRYSFPDAEGKALTVKQELSGFTLAGNGPAWIEPYDTISKWTPGYEKFFINVPAGSPSPKPAGWCFPALFQVNNAWVLLTESNVDGNYFASHLQNGKKEKSYLIQQPDSLEAYGIGNGKAISDALVHTPWRVIIAGTNVATVVESNLVSHVADAPTGDFSWVKPGRASWSWWSNQESTRDFKALKKYVDFSAEMGWEYSLVDANWNEMKGGTLAQLVQYAATKNVGIWAWYNSGGPHNTVTEQPRDKMHEAATRVVEMRKLQSMGVKGIKVDFFQSDKQFMVQEYMGILKDAAEYHIMVNFHGCTVPRGWSRTWPNLLSMESVRGAECYLFARDFPGRAPSHNVSLVFTRNVVGPMDYTPVTFSKTKLAHLTTNSHELALSVLFETGILHLADASESYRSMPPEVKAFLKNVPVVWDETRFLSGNPESHVVIARRSGTSWYIAGINGENKRQDFSIDLSFLRDDYALSIIRDGKDANTFTFGGTMAGNTSVCNIAVLPYGGFLIMAKPK